MISARRERAGSEAVRGRSGGAVREGNQLHTRAESVLHLQGLVGNRATLSLLNIQRGQAASAARQGVGRNHAVQVLKRGAPGSAAEVMLGPVSILEQLVGDVGSGAIGQHYEESFEVLNRPVTRRLLMRIALRETAWWNQQPGFPGWAGSQMSAKARFMILQHEAIGLGHDMKKHD